MFDIRVMFDGEVIGHMTPEKFRKSAKSSSQAFLSDVVADFNAGCAANNDSTRVSIVLKEQK
jgi:hypothetical protein